MSPPFSTLLLSNETYESADLSTEASSQTINRNIHQHYGDININCSTSNSSDNINESNINNSSVRISSIKYDEASTEKSDGRGLRSLSITTGNKRSLSNSNDYSPLADLRVEGSRGELGGGSDGNSDNNGCCFSVNDDLVREISDGGRASSVAVKADSDLNKKLRKEKNRLTAVKNRLKEKHSFEEEKQLLGTLRDELMQLEKKTVASILINFSYPKSSVDLSSSDGLESASPSFDSKSLFGNVSTIEELEQRASLEAHRHVLAQSNSSSKASPTNAGSDDDDIESVESAGASHLSQLNEIASERREKNKIKSRRTRDKRKIFRRLIQTTIEDIRNRINIIKQNFLC